MNIYQSNTYHSVHWGITPPLKNTQIFLWTPKILKLFIFTPSDLLNVTKFLVKISQFEFLVMREQSILLLNFFLWLNFPGFSSSFHLKTATPPPEKSHPSLFKQPPLKTEVLSSPLPFWKFSRRFNHPPPLPPSKKEGGGAHYTHRKNLSWLHFNDEPKVQKRKQRSTVPHIHFWSLSNNSK